MSTLVLPLAATAAAALLTYWFCVRPMRHGHGYMQASDQLTPDMTSEFDVELVATRAELDQLRAATVHAQGAEGPHRRPHAPLTDALSDFDRH